MATGHSQKTLIAPEWVIPAAYEEQIHLTLSRDEAQTLLDVLGQVGGPPWRSRRKHVDTIIPALNDSGLHYSNDGDIKGEINFI